MTDINLVTEIVKTLDYSNTSKERLLSFVQSRDQRVISAVESFIRERDGAAIDSQKHMAMVQLKKELDIVLFGKPSSEFLKNINVSSYTYTSSSLGGTQITQSPISAQYNLTTYETQAPLPTTLGASYSTQAYTYTNSYSNPSVIPSISSTYGTSGLTSYNTGSISAHRTTGSQSNLEKNVTIGSNDYYQNLLTQTSFTQPSAIAQQSSSQPISAIQQQEVKQVENNFEEEEVKRKRNIMNDNKTEFQLDQEMHKVREVRKAKLDTEFQVKTDFIKKEQYRLTFFKEKYKSNEPLDPELYKMFYDAADELDYAGFLCLRQKLDLDDINITDLIKRAKEMLAKKTDGLNPLQYLSLMNASSFTDEDVFYLLQIFFYLDFNNNGLLDSEEILIGFVMLANASEKEKLQAAFYIFDNDGSETLDLEELTRYMRCVIRMGDGRKFSSDQSFEHEFLIEKIASATSKAVFKEIDLDNNGRISYEEFVIWHNMHGYDVDDFSQEKKRVQGILQQAKVERSEKLKKFNAFTKKTDDLNVITYERLNQVLESKITELSIQQFREMLHFDQINFLEVVDLIKNRQAFKVADKLSYNNFSTFMLNLFEYFKIQQDPATIKQNIQELYGAIDLNSNGIVELTELLGALSLLCAGTENEKIRGIFDIFDDNGDGFLQFNELYTLFTASFNLIFMRNPDSDLARNDPTKLAFAMALSAFTDNQLDPYQHGLDFNTFSTWYKNFNIL